MEQQQQPQRQQQQPRHFPSNAQNSAPNYTIETDHPPSYYDAVNLHNEVIDRFTKHGSGRTGQRQRPERRVDAGRQQHVMQQQPTLVHHHPQQQQHQHQQPVQLHHRLQQQNQQQHRQQHIMWQQRIHNQLYQQRHQQHQHQQQRQQQLPPSVQISRSVSANARNPIYSIETDLPPSYDEAVIKRQ